MTTTLSMAAAARARRLRHAISAVHRRLRSARELLIVPRMELAAARQMVRSQRQLRVLRRQMR